MKRTTVICAAALVVLANAGAAWWYGARDTAPVGAAPAASGSAAGRPASAVRAPGPHDAPVPNPERQRQLALELERALLSQDARQRETAFNYLLPELLDSDPARVVALVARQEGEPREALRDEVAHQWVARDRDAAARWMHSLGDDAERRSAATIAVRRLAAGSRPAAIAFADEFGVGRDDGSLEHLVQIWAAEDREAALRWIEAQPRGERTAQLRARIGASP